MKVPSIEVTWTCAFMYCEWKFKLSSRVIDTDLFLHSLITFCTNLCKFCTNYFNLILRVLEPTKSCRTKGLYFVIHPWYFLSAQICTKWPMTISNLADGTTNTDWFTVSKVADIHSIFTHHKQCYCNSQLWHLVLKRITQNSLWYYCSRFLFL